MKKVLIVLFALAVVCPVLAQDEPEGPPPIAIAAHNQITSFLELTEDQVAAWDEIYLIHREEEQPVRDDIWTLEAELKDLLNADDPDPAAVGELVIEIAGLREILMEIHLNYHESFVDLLDEDQEGRLEFIANANRVQWIIPSFKVFELIRRR